MQQLELVGLGGGCHWCTEAVFQSLKGVEKVEQGWIASEKEASSFSEAVVVHFNPYKISLKVLAEIHLLTHKSTSDHSMRKKYRSAIYYFDGEQQVAVNKLLKGLQSKFEHGLITQVLPYVKFKPSAVEMENYYYKNPKKPYCASFIDSKLKFLLLNFSTFTDKEKLKHLNPKSFDNSTVSLSRSTTIG